MSSLSEQARAVAGAWGLELGEPFALGRHSYVCPAGSEVVLKVRPEDDTESAHEADALRLWDGDGAVRLLRVSDDGRAMLLERAIPGTDLSQLDEGRATAAAVEVGLRLWRPAGAPFQPVAEQVARWLDEVDKTGSPSDGLIDPARALLADLRPPARTLVHGDFHHHNILSAGERFVAIDPKPMLGEPEFDVAPFLWNPLEATMSQDAVVARLSGFEAAGLDPWRMRAWAVIRAAYLGASILDAGDVEILRGLVG